MIRTKLLISFILFVLMLSSCDKKNASLVNRRTATPERIEQIKEAQRAKEEEERVKAKEEEERVKAKEKADADARRNVALCAHDAACAAVTDAFNAANRDHDVEAGRVFVITTYAYTFDARHELVRTVNHTYTANRLVPNRTAVYDVIRNHALADYNYAIKTATANRLDAIRTADCDDTVTAAETTFNTVTTKALDDYKAALVRANAADRNELIRKQNEKAKRERETLEKKREKLRKEQEALGRVHVVLRAYEAPLEAQEVQEAQEIIQKEQRRIQKLLDSTPQEIAREKMEKMELSLLFTMEMTEPQKARNKASAAIVRAIKRAIEIAIERSMEEAPLETQMEVFEKMLGGAQKMLQEVQEALQGVQLARGGSLLARDPLEEMRKVLQGVRAKIQEEWQKQEKERKWKEARKKKREKLRKEQEALRRVYGVLRAYEVPLEAQEVLEAQEIIQKAQERIQKELQEGYKTPQEIAREMMKLQEDLLGWGWSVMTMVPKDNRMWEEQEEIYKAFEEREEQDARTKASAAIIRAIARATKGAQRAAQREVFEKMLGGAQKMLQEVQEALQGVDLAYGSLLSLASYELWSLLEPPRLLKDGSLREVLEEMREVLQRKCGKRELLVGKSEKKSGKR
ncbi:hypothetical protein AGMMS49990_09800 [Endomicrobiia bacterium]|nr:hypothetical protein AGMMS49990_09800 [Endomicrobiia bacterium]